MPLPRPAPALIALGLSACAAPGPAEGIAAWLASHGTPVDVARADLGGFDAVLADARVVGLGEATHGQHESFELKRALTMRLVRAHGFRLVAYEASAARVRACEEFVSGRSDDLDAAVRGLGMLIWDVEENAALLRDLRGWNATAGAAEQVHIVGIDVQDPGAAAARIAGLLEVAPDVGARATALAEELEPAVARLWKGDIDDYQRLAGAAEALVEEVEALCQAHPELGAEVPLRARELRHGVEMFRSHGGRDRALAAMMLDALARAGPEVRAVIWAHNGHVTRAPLRYLGSDELAMGGHLGAALGDGYYALGVLFGAGGFQANDRGAEGAWGFRRYALGPPPRGSLEEPFVAAACGDLLVDLRGAPADGPIGAWLDAGHGQRWFGGYGVPADLAAATGDAARLPPTFPRADYDGLAFLAHTTPAMPRDASRILTPDS